MTSDNLIKRNVSLKEKTTLKVGGEANYYIEVKSVVELIETLNFACSKDLKVLVIGDGSNIVIPDSGFDGIVIRVIIKEIIITKETEDFVLINAGAGVNWDDFVEYCVSNNYWGIENLSLIPGTVGAFPVQNVGAYGQVAGSVVSEVHVVDKKNNQVKTLTNNECKFSWRSSIFNTEDKNKYIISHVSFKLLKKHSPQLSRLDLKREVYRLCGVRNMKSTQNKSIQQLNIRQAVINLRTSGEKLPNCETEYNTGTFFRALSIKKSQFFKLALKLLINYGLVVTFKALGYRLKYGVGDSFILPSALLLKKFKTIKSKNKNFQLFKKNPAVLIHNGKGSHKELMIFINDVKAAVYKNSGINIPVEPEIIGENVNLISN